MSTLKRYFLETRPHFLVLSVVVALLGTGMAMRQGEISLAHAALCLAGLLLLHISTNVLNDYFDHKSGIDLKTRKTPFSGGSGLIQSGAVSPGGVLGLGLGAFFLACPIGAYFILVRGPVLLPLFTAGALFVLLGTSYLTRTGFAVGELSAGLGLGTLPVAGIYMILRGHIDAAAVYASVPSGILVFNLLFLNEFPDAKADLMGGRRTLVITLGRKKAARVYAALTTLVFLWIAAGPVLKLTPAWTLLGLLTLPLAVGAMRNAFQYRTPENMLKAQGANTVVILATQFLLAAGYFISIRF
jgi:1,4-dihydroxy-2-naphthoate octaprenyltransferase